MKSSVLENLSDFLTVENIKYEIMRTAYGNPQSLLHGMDARAIILWYLVFSIIPWFFYDLAVLTGLFLVVAALALFCRVSPLLIGLMGFGFLTQIFTTLVLVLFFGGDSSAFFALLTVSLKLLIVSLATISIFTSMDPERLSDALLRFGLPDRFCFSVSYGYRILPILIDEYNGIFNSFRLRGVKPREKRFGGLNIVAYYVKLIVLSFYPMLLNTAKRVKLTVEALETKGFSRSVQNRRVMEMKLGHMKITGKDVTILSVLSLAVAGAIVLGKML